MAPDLARLGLHDDRRLPGLRPSGSAARRGGRRAGRGARVLVLARYVRLREPDPRAPPGWGRPLRELLLRAGARAPAVQAVRALRPCAPAARSRGLRGSRSARRGTPGVAA